MMETERKPKILVVGSMNLDLCLYGLTEMPRIGVSTFGSNYKYATGGKGANQALAIAKQGGSVTMVGRVGDDDDGAEQILGSLAECGVDTRYVVKDKDSLTGLSFMGVFPDGKYFSVYAPGANNAISPDDVKKALDENPFDMIVLQMEMPFETVEYCCAEGHRRGIPVFLDAGPAMEVPLEKLRGTFVISPNEAEAEALTGQSVKDETGIRRAAEIIYQEAQPLYVIMKLGDRGAVLYDGNEFRQFPAFKVNAVDTTAAGDTFGATFAVQYCSGSSVDEAIRIANVAACLCVTRKGGYPSIPTKEETADYMRYLKTADLWAVK